MFSVNLASSNVRKRKETHCRDIVDGWQIRGNKTEGNGLRSCVFLNLGPQIFRENSSTRFTLSANQKNL